VGEGNGKSFFWPLFTTFLLNGVPDQNLSNGVFVNATPSPARNRNQRERFVSAQRHPSNVILLEQFRPLRFDGHDPVIIVEDASLPVEIAAPVNKDLELRV